MTPICRALPATAAFLLLAGCSPPKLPVAPSVLTGGVTIYQHLDFGGASSLVTADLSSLWDYSGPCESNYGNQTQMSWGACVSSLKVAPGWRATIYRDKDYRGESLEVTGDVRNLQDVAGTCEKGGLNDCITSIRVRQQ